MMVVGELLILGGDRTEDVSGIALVTGGMNTVCFIFSVARGCVGVFGVELWAVEFEGGTTAVK